VIGLHFTCGILNTILCFWRPGSEGSMADHARKVFGAGAAGIVLTAAVLAVSPARAGGTIRASDLPNPELGAPQKSRASNQPPAPAARVAGHGVVRPDRECDANTTVATGRADLCALGKPIEDARKALGGDPGGDGA
jgi:hypothetical protein